MTGMEPKPREPGPTIAETAAGLMFVAGFMSVLVSLPLGIILPLQVRRKLDFDWTWTIIFGLAITITLAVVGLLLILSAQIICWWRWGEWPSVFWSHKKQTDSEKC
jgi:ABC-type dipeptide/oligopeptide/nickel transport system permease component